MNSLTIYAFPKAVCLESPKSSSSSFSIVNVAIQALKILGENLYNFFAKIDAFFEKIILYVFIVRPLHADSKITSVSLKAINHSYAQSSDLQKKALEEYVTDQAQKQLGLGFDEAQKVGQKIATDKKIYDIGGLCLGYSTLFSLFMLWQKKAPEHAEIAMTQFLNDPLIHKAPLIPFINYTSLASLVKKSDEGKISYLSSDQIENGDFKEGGVQVSKYLKAHLAPTLEIHELKAFDLKIAELKETASLMKKAGDESIQNMLRTRFNGQYEHIQRALKQNLKEDILELVGSESRASYKFSVRLKDSQDSHALSLFICQKTQKFVFFDSNSGIIYFDSLQDLARGVHKYCLKNYQADQAYSFIRFTF
jgi:hypothetical protein